MPVNDHRFSDRFNGRIELLAPAKDLETGLAAINSGADAVYIGAARFGARQAAGNELADIEQLARYAHKYWARVYVTVNTLLYDDELEQAVALIRQLYNVGVDALIIQDVGLLECDLPPLPLIASTQMHNHTPERVAFLEQVGFQRAILARELSLEQIRQIRQRTQIELEVFVHGALCVSYSGQCYMSYAIGGRSGNRGQCAQPCRRRYQLVDGRGAVLEDRYLLSLRDLNLSDDLAALLQAGVCSFKIEGRLKDRFYVMNVVSHYRQRLDAILEGGMAQQTGARRSSSGRSYHGFTPDPLRTFNRGYTTYFLHGRGDQVSAPATPKSIGQPVGQVQAVAKQSFNLDGQIPLQAGDGLCFFDRQGELRGAYVSRVQGNVIFLDKMEGLAVGVQLYRNYDHAFQAVLEASPVERKIEVSLRLEDAPDGLALSARDEVGVTAHLVLPCEKIPAQKPELICQAIERQLSKFGGTEFRLGKMEIALPQIYYAPVALLNALRRGVLERLAEARLLARQRQEGSALRNNVPFPETKLAFTGNVLNQKAAAFYRRHGVTEIEPAAESGLEMRGRKVMTTKLCIKYQLGACPKENRSASLQEPLYLLDEQGREYPLRFNCAACEMEIYYQSALDTFS